MSGEAGALGGGSDGDEVLTLQEVVEAHEAEEAEAIAVLGASDSNLCSYDRGYVPRQALFACLTCRQDGDGNGDKDKGQDAGLCLACSTVCHRGHDIAELYTKRKFRCDCGNSRLPNPCTLCPDKAADNPSNSYNHNFRGLYCTCDAPNPEPEDAPEDSQVQCIVCEDWFHTRHLNPHQTIITNVTWEETVCRECVSRLPWLGRYAPGSETLPVDGTCPIADFSAARTIPTSTTSPSQPKQDTAQDSSPPAKKARTEEKTQATTGHKTEETEQPKPAEASTQLGTESNKQSAATEPSTSLTAGAGLFFNDAAWRESLCRCKDCLERYSAEGVEFLLEPGDTVLAYEEEGRAKAGAPDERLAVALEAQVPDPSVRRELAIGFKHLGEEGRAKAGAPDERLAVALEAQVPDPSVRRELAIGFKHLGSSFTEFLSSQPAGKVITEKDIQDFFQDFKAKNPRPAL